MRRAISFAVSTRSSSPWVTPRWPPFTSTIIASCRRRTSLAVPECSLLGKGPGHHRKAGIHSVIDGRMVVVKFLVDMRHAGSREFFVQQAGAVHHVVLVDIAAIDVE